MEIQGLSDAQNIHSQHGASHGTVSLSSQSAAGSRCRFICPENDAERQLELYEPQRDSNNNTRSGTSQFHLLAENGSETACLSVSKAQAAVGSREPGNTPSVGLYNVNTVKENELNALLASHDSAQSTWKYGVESLNSTLQMALPLFEGEEEQPMQQRQLTLPAPGLRQQQREDGAFKQRPLASRVAAEPKSFSGANRGTQEVYVVLNVVQGDGNGRANKQGVGKSCEDGGEVNGEREEGCKARLSGFMEVGYDSDNLVCECVDTQALRKGENVYSVVNGNPAYLNAKQSVCRRTVEDVVLTNKYGDKICGQICTENDGAKLAGALSPQPRIDEGITLMSGSSVITETMETSDFISDAARLQNEADPVTASTSPPASETFSGTIMINNQSIIVTIENGVLTLAAPPEGHVHKEDDMVSLKEHLGMKDHEDIVLLNYDSGTKSIGKISTLAVSSASHQEEPRPGLSVSDSELALVDDCPLSELGTSLDSCSIIKQEAGELCAVTEADLVTPSPRVAVVSYDNEDLQSVPPVRSKKETLASFCCPEPGCSSTFDTRQKLKVHLLNHAEDPRPHQCHMEGCGWAFATSYKLKRHLQSHDKQRPHICQFEGCGRRFTTVYNLKAHVKVHEHDNSFICEICSERFRSAARLANHQRVHFEPERPHKCEFPGNHKLVFANLYLVHPLLQLMT